MFLDSEVLNARLPIAIGMLTMPLSSTWHINGAFIIGPGVIQYYPHY